MKTSSTSTRRLHPCFRSGTGHRKKEDPLPSDAETVTRELDRRFAAMVAAYRRTGISIHGVESEIGFIDQLIQRLPEAEN